MFWTKKKINTEEYLELKKKLESLRIEFESLRIDFELIVKKLKVKYKIAKKDDEPEDLKNSVLLPDNGNL